MFNRRQFLIRTLQGSSLLAVGDPVFDRAPPPTQAL